jgi:hypothetical protein
VKKHAEIIISSLEFDFSRFLSLSASVFLTENLCLRSM